MTEAITFRAEPDFIKALRARASSLGMSVNSAIREMLAPLIGFSRSTPSSARPRNDLMRFCGRLKGVDATAMLEAQKDFERIDEDAWK